MPNLTPTPNQQLQNSTNGKPQRPSKIQFLRLADSERKIGQSTEEQIKSALKYVFVLLGLSEKDMPDDYEKVVILNFIQNHYGIRYSCQDIRNAFEFGIAGTFPVDKELYGKRFSPLFFSRFMDAYGEYKVSMLKHYKPNNEEIQLPPKIERSPQEMEEAIYRVIEKYINEHQNIPPIYDINSCYNVLVRRGVIVPTAELDEQKKQLAIAQNNAELGKRFLSMNANERLQKKKEFEKPDNLQYEIKRHYLLNYWAEYLIVARS